jgi:hypothetical protein
MFKIENEYLLKIILSLQVIYCTKHFKQFYACYLQYLHHNNFSYYALTITVYCIRYISSQFHKSNEYFFFSMQHPFIFSFFLRQISHLHNLIIQFDRSRTIHKLIDNQKT